MKRVVFFLFNFVFVFTAAFSSDNETDLSITVDDIDFNNQEEKNTIEDILSDRYDSKLLLKLIWASEGDFSDQNYGEFIGGLDQTVSKIRSDKFDRKKPEKRMKLVYNTVHEKYFKKYDYNPGFEGLPEYGIYNCVTASFVYAMILEELGVSYEIRQTPNHVYLISYPNSASVILESTDPSSGYIQYNQDYKRGFVKNLMEAKIISDEEFNMNSTDDLFEEHFFSDEVISLKELTGVYFANRGIALLEQEEYQLAFEKFKLAYLLYPSEQMKFNLMISCVLTLDGADFTEEKDLENYLFASRFLNNGIDEEPLFNSFLLITDTYLVKGKDEERYDDFYQSYSKQLNDSAYLKKVEFAYNYQKGRVNLIKGKYDKGYYYTQKALMVEPTDVDVHSNLIISLANLIDQKTYATQYLDSAEFLTDNFEELSNNLKWQEIIALGYLSLMMDEFVMENGDDGLKYLNKFESFIEGKELAINQDFIGRAYSEAAVYFFKRGNDRLTHRIINNGLELAPSSRELRLRKSMISY